MGHVKDLKTGIKYKDTPIGKIPVDWELAKLKRIATGFYNGGTPDTTNMDYWDGSIPWITGADFEDQKVKTIRRYITSDGVKNSATNVVPKGNLLIVTRTGVGKIAIAPFDIAISQDITGVILDSQKASPEFIYWYIDFISTKLKSTIQGTSISGLLRDDLEEIDLPLPTIAEQKKIAEILTTVDEAIEKTDQIIEKTKEVKKGLMQKLLTRGIGHKKFKKTEIGEIPEEWTLIELRGVVTDHKAGIYKPQSSYGSGYNIVGVADLYYHDSIKGQIFKFVNLTPDEKNEFSLKKGDIVYGESSLVKDGIGKALVVRESGEGTVFAWHTRRLTLDCSKVEPLYLHYILNSPKLRRSIINRSTQTALTGVTVKEYLDTLIPLPSVIEQKRVAEILCSIDEELEKESNHKEQLEVLKKGLMQALLTGKIRVSV